MRCRGLPFPITSAKADELREFFAGLTVARDGVFLCVGLDGRPNGEAFVRFEDAADAVKALGRDRQKMDRRYIEVFPPPPPPRTKWTRRVPHPVLIGHAASLTPY